MQLHLLPCYPTHLSPSPSSVACESGSGANIVPISRWIDPKKFVPALNFVRHLETAQADARSLLEKIGAWESFGYFGWGEHGNEAIFASKDKLTDAPTSGSRGHRPD